MQEYTEAALFPAITSGGLADAVADNAADEPDRVVLVHHEGDVWNPVTAREFHEQVRRAAKGLVAAGVAPGDRVAIMSRTRYEWTLVDFAIWYAGAVGVPIYETSSAEQVQWILSDSGAVGVFVEGAKHQATFDEVSERLPGVQHVWTFDEGAVGHLEDGGAAVSDEALDARRSAVTPDDPATIIYTSGTTGRPKGCELTHGNFLFEVRSIVDGIPEMFKRGAARRRCSSCRWRTCSAA